MKSARVNNTYRNIQSGFTLVELVITLSVFLVLSTAVVVNFRGVDNSLVLQNVAHQVGLVVRKAQISGISALGVDTAMTGDFNHSYGVAFTMSGPTPYNTFSLFVDKNDNGSFNGPCPSSSECVQGYTLLKNYTFTDLCGNQKTGGGQAACGLNGLSIFFTRPNPDAVIKKVGGPAAIYSDAEIKVRSPSGKTATIVIWKTGQISIE